MKYASHTADEPSKLGISTDRYTSQECARHGAMQPGTGHVHSHVHSHVHRHVHSSATAALVSM